MSSDPLAPPVIDAANPMDAGMPQAAMDGAMPQTAMDGAMPQAGMDGVMPQAAMDPPHNERRNDGERAQYKRSIYALPISMQVVIGSARPTISELLQMKDGTVLTLSSKVDDPVDLCINDRVIARGELVETDAATGAIGVRLTEIVDISEDILNA